MTQTIYQWIAMNSSELPLFWWIITPPSQKQNIQRQKGAWRYKHGLTQESIDKEIYVFVKCYLNTHQIYWIPEYCIQSSY